MSLKRTSAQGAGVRNELSNVEVLKYYGAIDPPEGPGWKSMICCFHEEKRPSARSNGSGFLCHGCGTHGDSLKLIMGQENCGYLDSVRIYEELTGESIPKLQRTTTRQRVSFDVSSEARNYERDGGLFSSWSSRDS